MIKATNPTSVIEPFFGGGIHENSHHYCGLLKNLNW